MAKRRKTLKTKHCAKCLAAMMKGSHGIWRSEALIADRADLPRSVVTSFLRQFGEGISRRVRASGTMEYRLSRTTRNFLLVSNYSDNEPFTNLLPWMFLPAAD